MEIEVGKTYLLKSYKKCVESAKLISMNFVDEDNELSWISEYTYNQIFYGTKFTVRRIGKGMIRNADVVTDICERSVYSFMLCSDKKVKL